MENLIINQRMIIIKIMIF